jgi:hypothetical protein
VTQLKLENVLISPGENLENNRVNNLKKQNMNQINESLKKSCQGALEVLRKLKDEKYSEIQSNLEWCIGSYDYDKNPEGLTLYGREALDALKDVKTKQPRKVSKKVIEDLEKAIS